jgi:hypothetical protein
MRNFGQPQSQQSFRHLPRISARFCLSPERQRLSNIGHDQKLRKRDRD